MSFFNQVFLKKWTLDESSSVTPSNLSFLNEVTKGNRSDEEDDGNDSVRFVAN